jgi:branched-chain amino acid transport system permease protein
MLVREAGIQATSYAKDGALLPGAAGKALLSLGVLMAVLLPLVLPDRQDQWLLFVAIAVTGALGLHVTMGLAGQISLGHGAFLAAGAYAAYIVSARYGAPFLVGLVAAALVAAAYGLLVGFPAVRVRGFYLVLATLAAQFTTEWLIKNVRWISGGAYVAVTAPAPSIGPLRLRSFEELYFLALAVALVSVAIVLNLRRSRFGRALLAIKDQDVAAEILGVNVAAYKLMAFAVGAALAGIAGALSLYALGAVGPESFTLTTSINYAAMVIIGGLGSVLGTVLGATIVILLPFGLETLIGEHLSFLAIGSVSGFVAHVAAIGYGLIILAVILAEAEGLGRLYRNLVDYLRVWPLGHWP